MTLLGVTILMLALNRRRGDEVARLAISALPPTSVLDTNDVLYRNGHPSGARVFDKAARSKLRNDSSNRAKLGPASLRFLRIVPVAHALFPLRGCDQLLQNSAGPDAISRLTTSPQGRELPLQRAQAF